MFDSTPFSSFETFVSAQLNSPHSNKIRGTCKSTQDTVPREMLEYFSGLISFLKSSYSVVVETDVSVLHQLDKATRKRMCEMLQNLRIIHVTNIYDIPVAFGSKSPRRDTYLVCSMSSPFPKFSEDSIPNDSIQFATYDMSHSSFTQINLVKKSQIALADYSFDFVDYFMEYILTPRATQSNQTQSNQTPQYTTFAEAMQQYTTTTFAEAMQQTSQTLPNSVNPTAKPSQQFDIKRKSEGVTKKKTARTKEIPTREPLPFGVGFC